MSIFLVNNFVFAFFLSVLSLDNNYYVVGSRNLTLATSQMIPPSTTTGLQLRLARWSTFWQWSTHSSGDSQVPLWAVSYPNTIRKVS